MKLGDYGISRSVYATGGAKGFGGTEGFMAPEIMRYNGEEEYNERVFTFLHNHCNVNRWIVSRTQCSSTSYLR